MTRSVVRMALPLVGLLGALDLLHRAGDALSSVGTATEPALLLVGGLRHAALAAGWYLLATTAVGGLARLARLRPVIRLADRVTLPALRRLLDTSLGLSVLTAVVATPAAWAEPPPTSGERPPATMLRLPDEADHAVEPPPSTAPAPAPAPAPTTSSSVATTTSTLRRPPRTPTASGRGDPAPTTTTPAPVAPTSTTTSAPAGTTVDASPPQAPARTPLPQSVAPPPSTPESGRTWTVAPGQHFWGIARRVLAEAWARGPTDAETDRYWRLLVEANRDRLADRDNPDLLFTGQVLALPPPPPAPP